MKQLYNINFFRIFFTIIILYGHIIQHHIMPGFSDMEIFTALNNHISYNFGYMCDMFFILSGFFFFFSLKKETSFKHFVCSKIIRLLPVLIASLIGIMILSKFIDGLKYLKYENFVALFFLDDALIANFPTNNGAAWYINVMFWGYILYYCVLNLIPAEKRNYLVGLIVFFAYSILLNKMYLYNEPQIWNEGILTIYMIRGIAGMGLGYLFGNIYNSVSEEINYTRPGKVKSLIFTIIEITTFIYLFKFSIIKYHAYGFPFMMILFIALFWLFIYKNGYLSRLLDNKFIYDIGKYCFSIYMMQDVMFYILERWLWHNTSFGVINYPVTNIIIGLISCILLGIITYYYIEKPSITIYKHITSKNSEKPLISTQGGGGQSSCIKKGHL